MTSLGGVKGKILRVDLSSQSWAEEPIGDDLFTNYLGGRALGAHYLNKEVNPSCDPLGSENKLFFFSGPLGGTMAPTSSRFNVTTLSPLTGIYLYSLCSGSFGDKLKAAGYDGLVVEGCATSPISLDINQDGVKFIPSDKLWGEDTFATQELLKKNSKYKHDIEIACIGPAGEKLSKMACIISGTRAAGRGGPGAVMGSKNLKAIMVSGYQEVSIAKPEEYYKTIKEMYQKVKETPFLKEGMGRYGSAVSLGITKKFGIIPCSNWRTSEFEGLDGLIPEVMREFVIKDLACPTCPINCSKLTRAKSNSFKGCMTEGPEYETLYSVGSCCNIGSMDAVIMADYLCDKLGLDSISCGVTVAFAMECAEKGIMPSPYNDFKLNFGDAKGMLELINLMAYRKDVGDLFSDGCLAASKIIGQGSDYFAMHAKGMELGGYDPRGVKAQAMVLACGPRGGCHHAGGYVIAAEIQGQDRFAFQGKGGMVKGARDLRAFLDSAIYCAFIGVAVDLDLGAQLVSDITGMDFNKAEAIKFGERCSCLERIYNNKAGVNWEKDILPPRVLLEELPSGPSSGQKLEAEFDIMKEEFYSECGWNNLGYPKKDKLKELDLDNL